VRVGTRIAVLTAGDMIALIFAREVARSEFIRENISASILASAPIAAGINAFALLAVFSVIAMLLTGSLTRHRALNYPVRILFAAALAPIPQLLLLLPGWDFGLVLQSYAFTLASLWVAFMLVRQISERMLRIVFPRQRGAAAAILVGKPDGVSRSVERAIAAPGGDFRVVGYVATGRKDGEGSLGHLSDLGALVDEYGIEAVVLCIDLPADRLKLLIEECMERGCQVLIPARAMDIPDVHPKLAWHHDQPFLEIGSPVLKIYALMSKRFTDLVGSFLLLLFAAPILLVLAIAIKLDSSGPVFFLQERAGLGGRRFRMLKLRTMRRGADSEKAELAHLNQSGDARLFKIQDDPRVTKLGTFLRRWSLDELPQIFNVIKGDMSLVGPRPFFESDFQWYEDHHFRRLDAKPGLTGLWQISGRSEVLNFEDVIYLDRQYIEQWSFWLDISILFRTIPAVLRRTGAY
jgi:exopolysaccharide biosynthesis polyprenyl glycosylphosphotransferase